MPTLAEFGKRISSQDKIKEIAEMLSQSNEVEELFGKFPPCKPWSLVRRLRYWVGSKIIDIACSIMGDDAPYME